ncbi:MAG: MlaD family protein [Planctomycetota bacterium]|jgi:hypothetical protein
MDRVQYAIGLITLLLVLISGWFLFDLLSRDEEKGRFGFRIEFRDARGMKSGAAVKYRGVTVGTVRKIQISDDREKAVVSVVLEPGSEHLACHSSEFWIVSPRFSGFSGGVTGLDTLVRDSYLEFLTPIPSGPQLSPGSLLGGLESPLGEQGSNGLDPIRHGDLELVLLVPENHGLVVGADVRFRGVPCGEVRHIDLAGSGSFVEVRLRIEQRYRETVTDKSQFWVARPRISGALLSGMAVEDFSALLSPFVAYHSAPGEGLPVPDNYRCAALADRPDIETMVIPPEAIAQQDPEVSEESNGNLRLVRIVYEAVEDDWLSSDDQVRREGTGILYLDQGGQPAVITCRSACDAEYFISDLWGGDAEIKSEAIRVIVAGGAVLRAGRTWVDPEGRDLAVLSLDGAVGGLVPSAPELMNFAGPSENGAHTFVSVVSAEPLAKSDDGLPKFLDHRGSVCMENSKAVAILGKKIGTDAEGVLVSLALLPEGLRPAQ